MIEKMADFFESRINEYEEHMLSIPYIKNGYKKITELIPPGTEKLLDLGCGTGLELEEIYKRFPGLKVTGIDLSQKMLDKLQEKFAGKNIELIHANYFDYNFGVKLYDVIISYQTLHHFKHKKKIQLYTNLFNALTSFGQYIECDYVALNQEEENANFAEYERVRKENDIRDDGFYHFDTPCTIENQITMMTKAGFKNVKVEWKEANAVIIRAKVW